jgi:PAS domain S-box-containing protein
MRIKAFSPRRGQFATMLEDISEGKRIELRLEENELRYRLLFNFANEGILIMTLEGKIFEVNRAFARMHGYTVEELRKMDISNLDVRGKVALSSREDIVNRTLKGEVVQMEAEHVHKDGHSFPISITTSIINLNGKKYFQASHVDITERRREEATLLKLHQERSCF